MGNEEVNATHGFLYGFMKIQIQLIELRLETLLDP